MASPTEPSLNTADLQDIQAGPVVTIPTRNKNLLFFSIIDASKFSTLFKTHILPLITTSHAARNMRSMVFDFKSQGLLCELDAVTVSFTHAGLCQLFPGADTADAAFKEGQFKRNKMLGDDADNWLEPFRDGKISGLFEIAGHPIEHLRSIMQKKIKDVLGDAIAVVLENEAQVRPREQKGHEHFGFNDGISQPYVAFANDRETGRQPLPGQTIVSPGVLLLGQPGDPMSNRDARLTNGSFVVYRHLKQLVPEFDAFLKDVVVGAIFGPRKVELTDEADIQKKIDFLGARLMGRWKSGMPVVLTPMNPNQDFPVDNPVFGKDPQRNNNFDYGSREETPRTQFLCPFAAHARKTAPRTDIDLKSTKLHSIARAGMPFGPEVTDEEEDQNKTLHERGLSFMCFQSSLSNGFEFIQSNWSNNIRFPFDTDRIEPGFDPIIGQTRSDGRMRQMTGSDPGNLGATLKIPLEFVIAQGGEYFFLPSITMLRRIGDL